MTFSMTLNFLAVALAALGILSPVVGALVHNAGSVLVIVHSALLLKRRKRASSFRTWARIAHTHRTHAPHIRIAHTHRSHAPHTHPRIRIAHTHRTRTRAYASLTRIATRARLKAVTEASPKPSDITKPYLDITFSHTCTLIYANMWNTSVTVFKYRKIL